MMTLHFKHRRFRRRGAARWVGSACAVVAGVPAVAAPTIVAPDVVRVDLVASDAVTLRDVDMLAFDAFGNLLANRETSGATGGMSYVDVAAGTATVLVSGISRCDGITLHPSGAIYLTSEVTPAATTNRVFRVSITYGTGSVPVSATATSLTTSLAINNPEGIVALPQSSAFGAAGDLFVAEDRTPGRIFRLTPGAGNTASAAVLVDFATNLLRPEGITYGDFGGALPAPLLFTAETTDDNVLAITAGGAVSVLGSPTAVALDQPDNVAFGHDGRLYVSEDVGAGAGRIVRIAADGTHEVVLGGLNFPQGIAFDHARSELFIAEQGSARVWRARFTTATGDVDLDGDVDLRDYAGWQSCLDQPALPLDCLVFDHNRDDSVDISDAAQFVSLLTGPI